MRQPKTARTAALAPAMVLSGVDFRAWVLRAFVAAFCLGSVLMLTGSRLENTRLRYQLNMLHHRHQLLQTDVGRLEVELSNLARPQRIARLAQNMGLTAPRRDQVIVMNE